ncbi:hypothetical protein [Gloeobacter kilaueensis]|uniref:Uncharacterized protein n=1 Tax=Gloeobacter kilaueensis (strain ATCC BAA-2537 / CCAP 1431/1 / ULC 316 / JS1) TaxID=1183438 RepID=U5QH05_GLOK1|nr:hypothetical protein [Gloeobacter kilaueensis]AGY58257.1 hypothetical protein GKIL_2011 [Gloeobacter kilaueensis JS1]
MLPIDLSRLTRLAHRIRGCFSLVHHSRSPEKKECLILNGRYPVHVVSTEAQYQHCELHGIPVLRAPLPDSDEALLHELANAFAVLKEHSAVGGFVRSDDLPDASGYDLAHELACRIEGQNCQGSNC